MISSKENRKKSVFTKNVWGGSVGVEGFLNKINRDEFLTLFDTCYSFVCEVDDNEIHKLVNMSVMLAKEPMKTRVWKPRAFHHVKLLVDGICKQRCLFKDYDSSFVAKKEDYDMVDFILWWNETKRSL